MRVRIVLLWLVVAAFAAAAALAVIGVLFPDAFAWTDRLLGSSIFGGVFGGVALASTLASGRLRRYRWPVVAGAACAGLAGVAWIGMIWRWHRTVGIDEDVWIGWGATFTILSLWGLHHGLLRLPPYPAVFSRILAGTTIGIATLLAVLSIVLAWDEIVGGWGRGDGVLIRAVSVGSILVALGTVVAPIVGFIERQRLGETSETAMGSRVRVRLQCPRCDLEQALAVGRGRCAGCGLRIGIEIEEPRCACGYLLYRLEGDACPECGRAVEPADRWATGEAEATDAGG